MPRAPNTDSSSGALPPSDHASSSFSSSSDEEDEDEDDEEEDEDEDEEEAKSGCLVLTGSTPMPEARQLTNRCTN